MTDDTPLRIQIRRPTKGTLLIVLHGDLDFDTAESLVDAALRAMTPSITELCVDVSGLYICDSSGLSALIHLHQDARRIGAGFTIAGVTPQLRRILEVTGLDTVLGVTPAPVSSIDDGRAAARQ